jgi:hypothetical protein
VTVGATEATVDLAAVLSATDPLARLGPLHHDVFGEDTVERPEVFPVDRRRERLDRRAVLRFTHSSFLGRCAS